MSKKHDAPRSREELPQELCWDLSRLYCDMQQYQADFAALDDDLKQFCTYNNRLAESPVVLRDAIAALDNLERRLEKLYTYSHLKNDENTADAFGQQLERKIRSRAATIAAETAWFEPELMQISDERMQQLLDAPELAFYRKSLEELLRDKPHILNADEERLLGELSDVLGAPDEIFSALNDADLKFPKVNNEQHRKIEITHGNYIKFLESPVRKVRKNAFQAVFQTYGNFENTFASTLGNTVKRHVLSARLRKYPSALSAALFSDELPKSIYTNLIDAVHEKLPALQEYLKLRKKCLKVKQLDMYDLYNPLCPAAHREFSWDAAKKEVTSALSVMKHDYVETLERAFQERWVDVLECRGKRSGAYSSGCYDSVPYLLLNYQGTLNDVFTLAHELGHSMHSYYSNHNQPYHYADYAIFVAEVASITNEILLHHHMLKTSKNDRELRIALLNHLADEVRGTVYRQTMFAEFELKIHQIAEAGTPLTAKLLNEEYFKLNELYYGSVVHADPLIAHEWARIPHFYYNFYVFKYATGMAAALKFAKNILSGDDTLLERYLGFLKAGDSKNVLDILRDAGVDLSKKEVITDGLTEFEELVKELKNALDE